MVADHAVSCHYQRWFCHCLMSFSLRPGCETVKEPVSAGGLRDGEQFGKGGRAPAVAHQQHACEPAVADQQTAVMPGQRIEAVPGLISGVGIYQTGAEQIDAGDF